jgi:hypothetical protein
MKKNVGSIDQIVRIVVAFVLIMLTVTGVLSGTVGIVLTLVAAVVALTGFIRFCPLYLPFNINTWEKKKK